MYPGSLTFPGSLAFPGATSRASTPTGGAYVFRGVLAQRRYVVIPPLTALINYSKAVLRIQGQWVETEFPTEEQLALADLYFPGGYDTLVDTATAALLRAAGYTVDETVIDLPPSTTAAVGSAIVGTSTVAPPAPLSNIAGSAIIGTATAA